MMFLIEYLSAGLKRNPFINLERQTVECW